MKNRIICLVLAACLCLALCACGGNEVSGYQVVDTIGGQDLCVAFRDGDQLRDIITAGMMVLSAEGVMAQLSIKWLGEDVSTMPADAQMAGWLQNQPPRTFILGYYEGARPMCYEENGTVMGFDADMLTLLCNRLGWVIKFQPIPRGSAVAQLKSGNVDCVAGGFGTADESQGLSLSPNYLSTEYEIISKAGGDVSRRSQLKGKVLATLGSSAMGKALEEDEKFLEKLGQLLVLSSEEECFAALDAGRCDAVLVSSLCADAYMK